MEVDATSSVCDVCAFMVVVLLCMKVLACVCVTDSYVLSLVCVFV